MLIPKRMLVVMPNWFGEVLFATPCLSVLRAAYPDAFIGVLSVLRGEEVLANNPDLDEFILYDEQGIHRTFRGKHALIHVLRSRRFDTALILRRSLTRTVLLALAGISRRIGFEHPKSGWLLTERIRLPSTPMHKAQTYLRLLQGSLGIPPRGASSRYDVSDQERASADRLLREQGVGDGRLMLVLHPGANWPHKRWLPERFAALADRLAQEPGRCVVITGGPEDAPLVQEVRRHMSTTPIVLGGTTTFRQLAACLERAGLVVSNDTGVLHLACALGRPVVALYGPTSPVLTGPLGEPRRTVVIHHPDCCPVIPCFHPQRPPHPGMGAISVDEVYEAACQMLASSLT